MDASIDRKGGGGSLPRNDVAGSGAEEKLSFIEQWRNSAHQLLVE